MMISPETYIDRLKDVTYEELIEKRDELLGFVTDFENQRIPDGKWAVDPSPEVAYQVYLQYLSALCMLMAEVYNRDFVWGREEQ